MAKGMQVGVSSHNVALLAVWLLRNLIVKPQARDV